MDLKYCKNSESWFYPIKDFTFYVEDSDPESLWLEDNTGCFNELSKDECKNIIDILNMFLNKKFPNQRRIKDDK